MLPYIWTVLRTYAPIITLPVAAAVGVIGYALESVISDKYTRSEKSVADQRDDRLLKEVDSMKVEKLGSGYPKSIFDSSNLSPQLRKDPSSKA